MKRYAITKSGGSAFEQHQTLKMLSIVYNLKFTTTKKKHKQSFHQQPVPHWGSTMTSSPPAAKCSDSANCNTVFLEFAFSN